jgi:hypothetical protein
MDLLVQRHERMRAIVPATELDWQRFAGIPHGGPFQIHGRFDRKLPLHRWWRGLMGKAADGLGVDPQGLHDDIKLKASLVERVLASPWTGMVAVKLRSTAFPSMDEVEFSNFVDVGIEILCRDYLGHIGDREQQKLILEWVGRRPKVRAAA